MWKYIVSWVVVTKILIDCPQYYDTDDEFGRKSKVTFRTSDCYRNDSTFKEKLFDKRTDATAFIKRGTDKKAHGLDYLSGSFLVNFRLDSIPLKQYECQHLSGTLSMLYCEPPTPDCNAFVCDNCGKVFPRY